MSTYFVPRFIGSIIRNHRFISLYSTAAWLHLALNITSGAYFIYTLYHKVGNYELNNCVKSYVGDLIDQYYCAKEFEVYRHVIIALYVIFCVLELGTFSSLSATGSVSLSTKQGFVSSSPVTLRSFGKRRRWIFRHPLRWLQRNSRRLRRHIT